MMFKTVKSSTHVGDRLELDSKENVLTELHFGSLSEPYQQ